MSLVNYQTDVVAWANQQAALIRAGQFALLDVENIAEEILDVGKSEQRELASRMMVLLAHLLKWQFQPAYSNKKSWLRTITTQRKHIHKRLQQMPSLKPSLSDPDWMEGVMDDAVDLAIKETGLEPDIFPDICPWSIEHILQDEWLPS